MRIIKGFKRVMIAALAVVISINLNTVYLLADEGVKEGEILSPEGEVGKTLITEGEVSENLITEGEVTDKIITEAEDMVITGEAETAEKIVNPGDVETAEETGDPGDNPSPEFPDGFGIEEPPYEYEFNDDIQAGVSEINDEIQPDGTVLNRELYPISIDGNGTSLSYPCASFHTSTPGVVLLVDHLGRINVIRSGDKSIVVQKYDPDTMKLIDSFTLTSELTYFGNITCDDEGYYYVTWGDSSDEDQISICVAKYDYSGSLCNKLEVKGGEAGSGGTKMAFHAGNCSMAVNKGILCINYAQLRYDGHQCNNMFYIDCSDMSTITGNNVFTSHSFDERVYPVSDGGFFVVNHGDANPRSFRIGKVNVTDDKKISVERRFDTFHFREGANRDYGYNETFAQLGGVAELNSAYVFAASSERKLSLAPSSYFGYGVHNDARDLFIQIIKKNLKDYTKVEDIYAVSGETRTVEDEKPESAATKLFLKGDEKDYGIIWLTEYDSDHYAAHPKVVSLTEDTFAILWEKMSYSTTASQTYYMVLDTTGKVISEPELLPGGHLASDIDPVFYKGDIYWATVDGDGQFIHKLDFDNWACEVKINKQPYVLSSKLNNDGTYRVETQLEAEGVASYKWYMSDDGTNWEEIGTDLASGQDTKKLTIYNYSTDRPVSYRCELTDLKGNKALSSIPVGILKQPEDVRGKSGGEADFEIKAFGAESYLWFHCDENGKCHSLDFDYSVKGEATSKLTVPLNTDYGAYKYRCRVRSESGEEVYSEPVGITTELTLLEQPKSVYAQKGTLFSIDFDVDGEGLTYQWYMKYKDDSWLAINPPTGTFPRLQYNVDDIILNSKFKCIVKDKYGDSVETDAVRVYENMTLALDKHSVTLISKEGSTAVLKADIVGPYDEDDIVWSSSDASVATVDKGVVTAAQGLKEESTAIITAKTEDGELTDSCTVTVVPPVIRELTVSLTEGETVTRSELAKTSADNIYSIEVKDETVASISEKGVIKGLKPGSTSACVTRNEVIYNISISVKEIEKTESSVSLVAGGKITDTTIAKSKADGKKYSIKYSVKGIVNVTNAGLIQGKKPGQVRVTITKSQAVHILDIKVINPGFSAKTYTKNAGDKFSCGLDVSDIPVLYSSNKPSVASVDDKGNITALAKGNATITALVQGKKYTAAVKVYDPGISGGDTLYLDGKTLNLKIVNGVSKTVWSSSNENTATVNNGRIKGVSAGKVVISAVNNGRVLNKEITVYRVPGFSQKKYTINDGDVLTDIFDDAGIGEVIYTSSNSGVAKVSDNGEITGLKKGSARITAECKGKKYTANVAVFAPVLSCGSETVMLLDNKALNIKVNNGTGKTEWSSSDEATATVKNGKVKALAKGTAVIRAVNNGRKMKCLIKVVNVPKFENKQYTVNAGSSVDVILIKDDDLEEVEYSVNNLKVAAIDDKGCLTGIKKGTVTVTAKVYGRKYTAKVKVL